MEQRVYEISHKDRCVEFGLVDGVLHWWTIPEADKMVERGDPIEQRTDICTGKSNREGNTAEVKEGLVQKKLINTFFQFAVRLLCSVCACTVHTGLLIEDLRDSSTYILIQGEHVTAIG